LTPCVMPTAPCPSADSRNSASCMAGVWSADGLRSGNDRS
jgi:hypothetical protein